MISEGLTPPSTSLYRPKGLIFPDVVKKGTRSFHFPRGLRTHRYHCIALWALMKSQPSKQFQPSQPFFPRGLRTHRYHCIALRALMKSQPSKPFQPSQTFFPRGLRTHRYSCVALRAY